MKVKGMNMEPKDSEAFLLVKADMKKAMLKIQLEMLQAEFDFWCQVSDFYNNPTPLPLVKEESEKQ